MLLGFQDLISIIFDASLLYFTYLIYLYSGLV